MLINLLPDLWRTLRGAWPLVLLVIAGGTAQAVVNLTLLLLIFGMSVGRTVTHFLTMRFRVSGGKLEIQQGLLFRQHRILDPTRIQNIEVVRNVFHRMFNLAELRIETAGDAGVEGLLSAISVEEAVALRAALSNQSGPVSTQSDVIAELSLLEVVAYGFSAGRVGAIALAVGLGMEGLAALSPEQAASTLSQVGPIAMIGLLLFSVGAAFLVSAANAILRYAGFRLHRTPTGIATEGGLFTRRRVELPIKKIQLVRVEEPWLRRLFGYASVQLETAAVSLPSEQQATEASLPMVAADELVPTVRELVRLDRNPWAEALHPAAPRALYRAIFGAILRYSIVTGALAFFFEQPWLLGLVLFAPIPAWLDWHWQGWFLTDHVVMARTGFFDRVTTIVARDKLQSVHVVQGPLMRWHGLSQVVVWVAGSRVVLPDIRSADAERLFDRLSAPARPGKVPVLG